MNIKNTVTLSDRYLRYAERMVDPWEGEAMAERIKAKLDRI